MKKQQWGGFRKCYLRQSHSEGLGLKLLQGSLVVPGEQDSAAKDSSTDLSWEQEDSTSPRL